MKVKWRGHELLLVTSMAIFSIAVSIVDCVSHARTLLPQIGSLLIVYLGYLWINFGMVPMVTHAAIQRRGRLLYMAIAIIQFFLVSYILGPVINFISFYAGPRNKGSEDIPLMFGYHPQPLFNVFGGWDVAMVLTGLYGAYAIVREVAIYYIDKPGVARTYRILVSNQATAFATGFFCLPFLLVVFRLVNSVFYHYYFAMVPPVGILLIGNYYWLFPTHPQLTWNSFKFLLKLFIYVVCVTVPFTFFLGYEWTLGIFISLIAAQILLTVPVSWFIYRNRKDAIRELLGSQTELAQSNADIQALRSQINPHFLFNALNALYATALREQSTDTATGIQQLGDIMRFMLHDNQQELIPMSSELDYLNNYIALQKLRIKESDDMVIEIHINDQDHNFLIAPMLLIPFVENAFKHGISLEQRSWINIRLEWVGSQLNFHVRNSLHPVLANDTEQGRSGIGLQNVHERLLLLYPDRHELHYGPQANEFVVTLTIDTNS